MSHLLAGFQFSLELILLGSCVGQLELELQERNKAHLVETNFGAAAALLISVHKPPTR